MNSHAQLGIMPDLRIRSSYTLCFNWTSCSSWTLCPTWAYAQMKNKGFSRKWNLHAIIKTNLRFIRKYLWSVKKKINWIKIVPAKIFGNDGLNILSGLFFARIFPCHFYWHRWEIWNEEYLETEIICYCKYDFALFIPKNLRGGPTLHSPTLHEDNSTQKLDTERLYTRAALHEKQ